MPVFADGTLCGSHLRKKKYQVPSLAQQSHTNFDEPMTFFEQSLKSTRRAGDVVIERFITDNLVLPERRAIQRQLPKLRALVDNEVKVISALASGTFDCTI